MTIEKELGRVEALYSGNIEKKGMNSQAVGWNTYECQKLRFDKLSAIALQDNAPFSVNDYGCGFGAHLLYLLEKYKDVSKYNGYDISEQMLSAANSKLSNVKNVDVNLINSSSLTTHSDYSFVSGTFNVRFDASKIEWQCFIETKLKEINHYTQKAFSFNLLTSYVDWEEQHLFYGDPCYWFDFCKKNFSKKVSLFHDYDLWEWTILVDKR